MLESQGEAWGKNWLPPQCCGGRSGAGHPCALCGGGEHSVSIIWKGRALLLLVWPAQMETGRCELSAFGVQVTSRPLWAPMDLFLIHPEVAPSHSPSSTPVSPPPGGLPSPPLSPKTLSCLIFLALSLSEPVSLVSLSSGLLCIFSPVY